MLISFYLPFTDFRDVKGPDFKRLSKPAWPTPVAAGSHVRGIGSIQARRKSGLEGWVGEDQLAIGLRSCALRLPYSDPTGELGRIRLIRKACYFDGLLNGRFEFLVGFERSAADRRSARDACDRLAETQVTTRLQISASKVTTPLSAAGPNAARAWSQATVAHGLDPLENGVMARRPFCVLESEQPLAGARPLRALSAKAAAMATHEGVSLPDLQVGLVADTSSTKPHTDRLLVSVSDIFSDHPQRSNFCRFCCRYLRTYTFRIFQDVECLSLLLNDDAIDIEEQRVQNFLNEYTRRIYRSRQRLEDFAAGDLIKMAYLSFESLYPGRTQGLRAKVQNSNIRPNIARKLLLLFDESQSASIIMAETLKLENIMGDKYENVKISGSQGVAVGSGASANVAGSSNVNLQHLSDELRTLAEAVLACKDKPNAEVEATIINAAADKAEAGDEEGAAGLLKKAATWVLEIAKTTGGAVLTAFMKARLGL